MINFKILTIFCIILLIIYRKLKKIYSYWERKGVKGTKPLWIVGNVLPLLRRKETLDNLMQKMCQTYPDEKAVGMYIGPVPTLILKDPNLIKQVLIKDFSSFDNRGLKLTEEKVFDSVFFEKGEIWKVYRQKLIPLFSTGRMKEMLPKFIEHTDEYLNYIENLPPGPKELRQLDQKLSIKLTMASSFGLTVDTLKEEFDRESIGDILYFPARLTIATILYGFHPKLLTAFGLRIVPEDLVENIINQSKEIKKDKPQEDETLTDFLLKLKEQGVIKKHKKDGIIEIGLSESVLAGHAAVFLTAGMEVYTSSSYVLFELSLNQDIQENCYREIKHVMEKYNGDLTFEALNELSYVNMAFDESLRKYPNGGPLFRVATKDYHFEDINLNIEKGTPIIIPLQAIHYDEKNFPRPYVFDPERFSPENKKMIENCTYLPFGDGPRKCIGFRRARLQATLLVAKFLHRFKVTPCEKTVTVPRATPLQMSLYALDGLWVNITKRK